MYSLKQLGKQVVKKLEFARGLQFTITAQIITVIAISFSIGNIVLYRMASEQLLDQTYQRYNDHVDNYVNSIERWERTIRETMHALSESPSIRSLDPETIKLALKPYFKLNPYRVWRVFDNSGKLLLSSNQDELIDHNKRIIELRLKHKDGYLKALNGAFDLAVDFMRVNTYVEGCMAVNQPIYSMPTPGLDIDKKSPAGVLRFCLPLSKLADDSGIANLSEFNTEKNNDSLNQPLFKEQNINTELELHRGDYSGQIFYIVT